MFLPNIYIYIYTHIYMVKIFYGVPQKLFLPVLFPLTVLPPYERRTRGTLGYGGRTVGTVVVRTTYGGHTDHLRGLYIPPRVVIRATYGGSCGMLPPRVVRTTTVGGT